MIHGFPIPTLRFLGKGPVRKGANPRRQTEALIFLSLTLVSILLRLFFNKPGTVIPTGLSPYFFLLACQELEKSEKRIKSFSFRNHVFFSIQYVILET